MRVEPRRGTVRSEYGFFDVPFELSHYHILQKKVENGRTSVHSSGDGKDKVGKNTISYIPNQMLVEQHGGTITLHAFSSEACVHTQRRGAVILRIDEQT